LRKDELNKEDDNLITVGLNDLRIFLNLTPKALPLKSLQYHLRL